MRDKHGIKDFGQSEPEFLISVMDRHKDWCVIVCLVGGGQEINDGEAGLTEWFRALKLRFREWRIYVSDQLNQPVYNWGRDLAKDLSGLAVQTESRLHLSVTVRSFRAETLSDFIIKSGTAPPKDGAKRERAWPLLASRRIGDDVLDPTPPDPREGKPLGPRKPKIAEAGEAAEAA